MKDFGNITDSYIVTVGWGRDTRDNVQFPSSGLLQNILLETGLPIGDLYYYKLNYLAQYFLPLPLSIVAAFRGDFGYGGGLGGKTLPFFKAYYAGGVGSVRGYESASLGPQDINGNTLGGRQKIVGNAELFFPMPGARPGDNPGRVLRLCGCRRRSGTRAISPSLSLSVIQSAPELHGIHRSARSR